MIAKKYGGSGLGMSIADNLIRQMGGVHCIIKCNKRYLKTLVAFIFLPEYPLFKRLSRDWRDAVGETEIQKIIV